MRDYKKIYKTIQDDISKKIFGYRVLFTETRDEKWIWEILKLFPEGNNFFEVMTNNASEKIIFGAGAWGKELAEFFPVGWTCFIDNYKYGTSYLNIPVISFDEYIREHKDAYVVLTARLHFDEMVEQLHRNGIDESKIINMGRMIDELSKKQYFDLEYLPHDDNEVFVDCGCLDAATCKEFIKWSNSNYKEIYAFEPDPNQIGKCIDALREEKAKVFDCGAWNEEGVINFEGFLEGSSHIAEIGNTTIKVSKLDDVLFDKKVTFLKMDIEGAELKALQGAKELIIKNKPKLAISIYHNPEDIYEIPELLLEYNPNYVFYLRHYSVVASETVLYAIDKCGM